MENTGFSSKVADYIVASVNRQTREELYEHATLAFLDTIAVALYARNEPLVSKLKKQAFDLGGNPQATILGSRNKVSVCQAALINGAMSHAVDYDDNLKDFMGHPSVCLVPSVLAIAEHRQLSGTDVLDSYLVGLEVGCWVSRSAGVELYRRGFHGTSVIGRQASTGACARLLKLNKEQTQYALGIAGTLANGVKQSFGTMCKPLHAGVAAEGGVQATTLAEDGFDSALDIYEGKFGLNATHHGENEPVEVDFLEGVHPVEKMEIKFHAACLCVHGPINAAQSILRKAEASAEDIEKIDVAIHQISMDNAGKTKLLTGLDGKFSTSYSVANALVTGATGPQGYTDDAVTNPSVLELMGLTQVSVDPELNEEEVIKGRVKLHLKDGRVLTGESDPLKEILQLPEKRERVIVKFNELCTPIFGEARTAELRSAILDLKKAHNVSEILSLCVAD
ncbi:MmgE/PrpD family protein [Hyphomonas sp.]|uniref:MmgE/PrpD family protein n=1 Tax=Hyphomonas sp. TaxID=87 RepID=UPI0032EC0351